MTNISFTIEGETFSFPTALLNSESVDVQSMPRGYTVRMSRKDPTQEILAALNANPKNLLFIDSRVWKLIGTEIKVAPDRVLTFEASEANKNLERGVLPLIDRMIQAELTKAERLIVVGGGITQEVAGMAACLYRRGTPWTLFPSTLLAMCDSCLGGKASVNYRGAKNQLALYYSPYEVILCPALLATLPEKEIRSGLGEILKLHITGGSDLLGRYTQSVAQGFKDLSLIRQLAWNALLVKKSVVERDEFEEGARKSMNYGHTLGHAIEILSNFEIAHGQAVLMGLLLVNRLATNRNLLSEDKELSLAKLCLALLDEPTLRRAQSLELVNLPRLLSKDKKSAGDMLTFVVITDPGSTRFLKLSNNRDLFEEIRAAYQSIFGSPS